jgi:hypothetical protein
MNQPGSSRGMKLSRVLASFHNLSVDGKWCAGFCELLLFSVDRVYQKGKFMDCLYFWLYEKFIDLKAGWLFVCA